MGTHLAILVLVKKAGALENTTDYFLVFSNASAFFTKIIGVQAPCGRHLGFEGREDLGPRLVHQSIFSSRYMYLTIILFAEGEVNVGEYSIIERKSR